MISESFEAIVPGAEDVSEILPAFDAIWYLGAYPGVVDHLSVMTELEHYLTIGGQAGYNPNPFFDSKWYLEQNADVAAAGWNPLVHYMRHGASELRRPFPQFDMDLYVERHPEAASNPLLHIMESYSVVGSQGAFCANPSKSTRDANLFQEEGVGPVVFVQNLVRSGSHLINWPWVSKSVGMPTPANTVPLHDKVEWLLRASLAVGFVSITPMFAPDWYRRQLPSHGQPTGGFFDTLAHYLYVGEKIGLSPNPFFSAARYGRLSPQVQEIVDVKCQVETYLDYYLRFGDRQGHSQCFLFDAAYYSRNYLKGDLGGADFEFLSPFEHYITFGWKGGFCPNPLFDEQWYIATYPAIAARIAAGEFPNGFSHFVQQGESEGLASNKFFDPKSYLDIHADIRKGVSAGSVPSAFWHYWLHGVAERRSIGLNPLSDLISCHLAPEVPRVDTSVSYDMFDKIEECLSKDSALPVELEARFYDMLSESGQPVIKITDFDLPSIVVDERYSLYFGGIAYLPSMDLVEISVDFAGKIFQVDFFKWPRADFARAHPYSVAIGKSLETGFFAIVDVSTHGLTPGDYQIRISFVFSRGTSEREFPAQEIRFTVIRKPDALSIDRPIQVCMATYNPPIGPTRTQVDSIIDQTEDGVALIISDDNSKVIYKKSLYEHIKSNKYIQMMPNSRRSGFVGNFERSLRLASKDADFIMFSDQDDEWYPNKVSTLKATLEDSSAICTFSDMRIVDGNKTEISPTFWKGRSVHYGSPIALSLANTVTGAAAMFKQSLVKDLLPFPRFIGLYHDQWLAVLSAAAGEIKYVDQPLYDYIQHGGNVLGFGGSRGGETRYSRNLAMTLAAMRKRAPAQWTDKECDYIFAALEQCQIALMQRYVLLREALARVASWASPEEQSFARDLCEFMRGSHDPSRLAPGLLRKMRAMRRHVGGDAALLGIDYLFKAALTALALVRADGHRITKRLIERTRSFSQNIREHSDFWQDPALTDYERKVAPIKLKSVQSKHVRVNIFLPELRLSTFFGGYYSKISLAKQVLAAGVDIRLVLIDQPNVDYIEVLKIGNAFPDLEDILQRVEMVALGNRNNTLELSHSDVLVATTWWSAHIVEELCQRLNRARFIYFIQEYEPFTFPLGTWYRGSEQTYGYPHFAIFSTEILREFFRKTRIGAFSGGRSTKNLVFRNPIVGLGSIQRHPRGDGKQTLLMYARPQPHAARNMYDFGVAALRLVAKELGANASRWEFVGVGADSPAVIPLDTGVELRLLAKTDFDGYRALLSSSSVGLALMYTPHPSLVPLEMAAAGLQTVTNTCFSKDANSFDQLSDNIIVSDPDVYSIAEAIKLAIARADDVAAPRSRTLDWPVNPEEAFPENWVAEFLALGRRSLADRR